MFLQTYAQIDLGAIEKNLRAIQRSVGPKTKVMPVVKDDAYGHGMLEVARRVIDCGVYGLAVARVDEGIALREAGIGEPILLLSPTLPQLLGTVVEFDLMQSVSSAQMLEMLEREARMRNRKAQVHVKLDTGINRTGAQQGELDAILSELKGCDYTTMEGFYTHFATSDAVDKSFAHAQMRAFESGIKRVRDAGFSPLIHACNSGGVHDLPQAYYDIVRPGISLYGYYPSQHVKRDIPLKPALTWKTHVVRVKEIAAGESVSYNCIFTAWRKTKVATIMTGYGDGYRRGMTEKAQVLIGGHRAPVIGMICMDLCMVDVTDLPEVQVGDEVVLLGEQGKERIDAEEMAAWCNTIGYEVLLGISPRVPRVY